MADPKRLVMLKALSSYLANEITIANGYQHDLIDDEGNECVYRGRLYFDKDDRLPMLSLLDNPDPDRFPALAGNLGYQVATQYENYVLLLQGWAKDDKINPTDPAHLLMADTKKALAKLVDRGDPGEFGQPSDVYILGGLIEDLTIEAGVVRPPAEQISEYAFFWMRLVVKYTEDPQDPYNLN